MDAKTELFWDFVTDHFWENRAMNGNTTLRQKLPRLMDRQFHAMSNLLSAMQSATTLEELRESPEAAAAIEAHAEMITWVLQAAELTGGN